MDYPALFLSHLTFKQSAFTNDHLPHPGGALLQATSSPKQAHNGALTHKNGEYTEQISLLLSYTTFHERICMKYANAWNGLFCTSFFYLQSSTRRPQIRNGERFAKCGVLFMDIRRSIHFQLLLRLSQLDHTQTHNGTNN